MKKVLFLLAALCGYIPLQAEAYQAVKEGPIHEAFVVKETGSLILEAFPNAPPAKITELIPKRNDTQAIWLPGYWSWSREYGIFLWVSGVWRRPPPGLHWIEGYWKNYPQGWVWVSGFWTAEERENVTYLPSLPPDPIDEQVPTPPASAENYFWVPGIWQFDPRSNQYVWYSGRWDLIGQNWVYCPAHYVWREKGYVFVPAFWDWPMPKRGVAFASIFINMESLDTVVYNPTDALPELFVMEHIFPHWPDYACLLSYHFYFHYDTWVAWGAIPPWWSWPSWWGFTRQSLWSLWWWWSHPGYPNPVWMNRELAQAIAPPAPFVVKMMQKITPPPIVTPNGVIGEQQLLRALFDTSGMTLPILPSDPKQVGQIQEVADPQGPPTPYLIPSGKGQPTSSPDKPFFGPPKQTLKAPPRRVTLPPQPLVPEDPIPPPQVPPPRKKWPPAAKNSSPTAPTVARSSYTPYRAPRQGYEIQYDYPQDPRQTLHQGHFMTAPQPQINPSGPNVHPLPGDYSTLPGQ